MLEVRVLMLSRLVVLWFNHFWVWCFLGLVAAGTVGIGYRSFLGLMIARVVDEDQAVSGCFEEII